MVALTPLDFPLDLGECHGKFGDANALTETESIKSRQTDILLYIYIDIDEGSPTLLLGCAYPVLNHPPDLNGVAKIEINSPTFWKN